MKFQHWGLVGLRGLLASQHGLLGLQISKKPCLKSTQGITAQVVLMTSTCICTHAETGNVNRDSMCSPNTGEALRAKPSCKTHLGPKERRSQGSSSTRARGRCGSLTSTYLRAAGSYRARLLLPVCLRLEDMWGSSAPQGGAECSISGRYFSQP